MTEKQYHPVTTESALDGSSQMHVDIDGEEILLVRDRRQYYAISYHCSHQQLPLEGGRIENKRIICPYHGAEFSLLDGSALAPPACEPLATYPVRVTDGTIFLGVDK